MRIVYFNYEWDLRSSSGAGVHVRHTIEGLRSLGHTVIPVDRHRTPDSDSGHAGDAGRPQKRWISRMRSTLAPYLHETAAFARSISGLGTELGILVDAKPDVVLTRYSLHQFSSIFAARRARVPIVLEVNAPLALEYRLYQPGFALLPGLSELTELRMLKAVDGVFTVSRVLRDYFVSRGVPAAKISINPNGADITRFGEHVDGRAVREQYGRGRTLIGYVGSFGRFHGIDVMRDAIHKVLDSCRDVNVLLVGHGERSEELKSHFAAHGLQDRVFFPGYIQYEEVPRFVAAMDVVLAPYPPTEVFYVSPIKLFEYMAAGKTVVATRIGQVAEVIQHGVNGLLCEPGSAEDLATQIKWALDHPEERIAMGTRARRTAVDEYTWDRNARRVEAALLRVVDATNDEKAAG